MTGRPAETWRKFTFSTPPAWTYALLVLICFGALGIAIAAAIIYSVSERATGHLPLTKDSRRLVGLALWIPVGLIIASPIFWIAAFPLSSAGSDLAGVFVWLGILALVFGLIGRLAITRFVGPGGKVFALQPGQYDRLVEISNVHPAFVTAVRQHQHARFAQGYGQQAAQLPESK